VVFGKGYIVWCSSVEWIDRNGMPCGDAILVPAGNLRKLWDFLSELRSYLCEKRLGRTVMGPVLLPVKTEHVNQFFNQV
jgi:hypothetical protein